MARTDPLFKLRLPDDLRSVLEKSAHDRGRSLTTEILERLQESVAESGKDNQLGALRAALDATSQSLYNYQKNIRLYSASAVIAAKAVKTADRIITGGNPLQERDIESWKEYLKIIDKMLEVVENFEVAYEPADEGKIVPLEHIVVPYPRDVIFQERPKTVDQEKPTRPKRRIDI